MSPEKKKIVQDLGMLLKKEMGQRVSDDEIRDLFNRLFALMPGFSAEIFQKLTETALGFSLFHEPLRLIKRWNEMAPPDKQLLSEAYLARARADYRELLAAMKVAVDKTTHLGKVFEDAWFAEVDGIIQSYDGQAAFSTDTHTAFIGFIQDGDNLLRRIETAYEAILRSTGNNRVKRLKNKPWDLARPLANYLGTVFEVLILGPSAELEILKEIEPKRGSNNADGLIDVDGTNVLIEATVTTSGRPITTGAGSFNPDEGADKVRRKIVDKAKQLQEAPEPILIFLSPYLTTFTFEAKAGIKAAFDDPECSAIVGVILADEYRANRLKVAWNPVTKRPIPDAVKDKLRQIYGFQELDMNDLMSDR